MTAKGMDAEQDNPASEGAGAQEEKHPVNWVAEVRSIGLLILAVLAFHSFVAKIGRAHV